MLIAICKSMQIIKKKKIAMSADRKKKKKKEVLNLLDKGND